MIWNIADGFEDYGKDYAAYNETLDLLVRARRWTFHFPVRKLKKLVFTDCGSAYLRGMQTAGLATEGFVYVMKKLC